MKVLIVGMGFGNLYKSVHTELGNEIVTVDTNGTADFTSIDDAIRTHRMFDITHICTPNFTHFSLANKLAKFSKIVFVEKPGVEQRNRTHRRWHAGVAGVCTLPGHHGHRRRARGA